MVDLILNVVGCVMIFFIGGLMIYMILSEDDHHGKK